MTRAKAGAAAITAAVLTAALHIAGSGLSYFLTRENVSSNNEVADDLVVRRFGEFGWPFGPNKEDLWLAFVVGLAVTVVVAFVVVLVLVRSLAAGSGGLAAFLGTWFAVLLATVIGKAAWTTVATETLMNGHSFRGWWTANVQSGAWWGLIFGWLVAALTAIAYAIANRGNRAWGYAREEEGLSRPSAAVPSAGGSSGLASSWPVEPQPQTTDRQPLAAEPVATTQPQSTSQSTSLFQEPERTSPSDEPRERG